MKTIAMTVEVTIRSTCTVQVEVPDDFAPRHYEDVGDGLFKAIPASMYVEQSRAFSGLGFAEGDDSSATMVVRTTPGGSAYLELKDDLLEVKVTDTSDLDWDSKFIPCVGRDQSNREVIIKPVSLADVPQIEIKLFPFDDSTKNQAVALLANSYRLKEVPSEIVFSPFTEGEMAFIDGRTAEVSFTCKVPRKEAACVSWRRFSSFAADQYGCPAEHFSLEDVANLVDLYIKSNTAIPQAI